MDEIANDKSCHSHCRHGPSRVVGAISSSSDIEISVFPKYTYYSEVLNNIKPIKYKYVPLMSA
jgi:hypothetical protein